MQKKPSKLLLSAQSATTRAAKIVNVNATRIVAKVALITEAGKILLLRRSETDRRRPLEWDLPGGAGDEGEGYAEAACRETLEEAGIVLHPAAIHLAYTMADMTDKGNVCWLYFTAVTPSELPVILSDEHTEYRWVPLSEASEYITYDRQRVALKYIEAHILA